MSKNQYVTEFAKGERVTAGKLRAALAAAPENADVKVQLYFSGQVRSLTLTVEDQGATLDSERDQGDNGHELF